MSDNNGGDSNWSNSGDVWPDQTSSGDDLGGSPGGDSFSETTYKSWFQRIMDSLKAIIIGLVLAAASCVLLFWNEGNSAKTIAALNEGAGLVTSIANDKVESANEGKLVHVAGSTRAAQPARDPDLGVAGAGLKLVRKVEMYQWKEERRSETRKKLGGGEETVTTYSYTRTWSDQPINSSNFREASNHANPAMPSLRSREFAAEGATLGAFRLDERVISQLHGGETFDAPESIAQQARQRFGNQAKVERGGIYVGQNPDQPRVGDIRVSFTLLPVQPVSVVGRQTQGGFTPYTTSNQRTILLAETGLQDAPAMFKHAQDANKILTWILRLVGVFVLFVGFRIMISLLEVLASFVPIFGDIVGVGASLVALLATAVIAPIVIAFAWLFYRPLWAAGILAAGFAIFYGLRQLAQRRAASRPAPAGYAPQGYQQPTGYAPQPGAPLPPQPQPPAQGGGTFLPPGFGSGRQ